MPIHSANAYFHVSFSLPLPPWNLSSTLLLLQGHAEEGHQATSKDGDTKVLAKADGSTGGASAGGLGVSGGGGRVTRATARSGGSGTAGARGAAGSLILLFGGLLGAAGRVLDLFASELLFGVALVSRDCGVNTTNVPLIAHLTGNRLLVLGHRRLGSVAALASVLESVLRLRVRGDEAEEK